MGLNTPSVHFRSSIPPRIISNHPHLFKCPLKCSHKHKHIEQNCHLGEQSLVFSSCSLCLILFSMIPLHSLSPHSLSPNLSVTIFTSLPLSFSLLFISPPFSPSLPLSYSPLVYTRRTESPSALKQCTNHQTRSVPRVCSKPVGLAKRWESSALPSPACRRTADRDERS